jgi:hypothetical protein
VSAARALLSFALVAARWWVGTIYLLGGAAGAVAGPIMIAFRDWGGGYMIVGGTTLAIFGWLIHPWGLQRQMRVPISAPAP